MTERDFCYWLQGLFEVAKPEALTKEQTAMVREHLALVFTRVTSDKATAPQIPTASPEEVERQARAMEDFLKAVERAKKEPPPVRITCGHGLRLC